MTSEYNRWPDKAGPPRRHFGRAVDRTMDSSTNFQAPPQAAYFLSSCDKVYHKQEV